jgi:type IV secretory pathway TraG/TraD family ATPase VirD4
MKPSGKTGDTYINVAELRGSEGLAFPTGKLCISRDERNRHVLVVAKTGSGKTSRFILPILYNDCMDPVCSTIVIDSKPEMWRKLAAMTRKYNPEKNILLFNPLDRARSLSWNILGKIDDDTDCKLIAQTIISATDQPQAKSDSPFFRNNALAILNSIMAGLLHDPNEVLSMPRIHEIVQSGMKPMCDWLEARPAAIRNSRTFVELARSGSQNADTIMSELSMRLSAWDLTAIRATTSQMELDIEDLISKPTLFIVELRESELEMLRPMANVIVVEILRFLTKRAEQCPGNKLPRPVGLVIDEFASALGRLPDIHVKLNTLRSRNVSIVAAIQSTAQVKANYSDNSDSVLAGFSTKIFMPALDLVDAEWASKESGQMTIRFQTQSTGANRKMI